ncbi:MAG: SAM-dependent methyltransferase [Bilophila wadsworthia]
MSSVFGAAAALGCELTCPDVSQSVVLTRTPGRTPMPRRKRGGLRRTGATLVFFLSTGKIDDLMTVLMGEGGLSPDTPAAVVYRATWPDERILRGTVSDIARKVEEAGFGRQALIFVGRALDAQGGASRLYGADFSHGYRNHLANEAFDGRCALYAFTDKGLSAPGNRAGLDCPR